MLQVDSTEDPGEGCVFLWVEVFGRQDNGEVGHLFQGWRILNFYRCDVEPGPFILAKYKRMKQFVFICKAAFSQQQSPQFSCYGRITPNPQSISVGVFFLTLDIQLCHHGLSLKAGILVRFYF